MIALIRGSADVDEARTGLMESFALTEIQAQAILEMRLQRLTGLERKRIEDEHADLQERIAELRAILGDTARIDGVVREELLEIKQVYGRNDDRRTEIVAAEGELELEDLIAEEDMVIAITRSGYIKRLPVTTYREQRRGGIGVMGMDLKEDDYIEHLIVASTHDYILFFTTVGKVYRLKVHELPLGSRQSKGRAVVNLLPFSQDEKIRAVIATRDFTEAEYLTLATKNGVVKKSKFQDYNTQLKADGIIAIKLREDDELVDVLHSDGDDDIMLVSRKGQAIRFSEKDARPMGRATEGVRGMKLRAGDEVIAAGIASRRRGPPRRDRERLRQAHARLRLPVQGSWRSRREDRPADRGEGPARRRPRRRGRVPGHAHLDRRHCDQDARGRHQALGPRHPGRDRDAPARRRDGLGTRAGGRLGRREWRPRRRARRGERRLLARKSGSGRVST